MLFGYLLHVGAVGLNFCFFHASYTHPDGFPNILFDCKCTNICVIFGLQNLRVRLSGRDLSTHNVVFVLSR
jgi:hypothetical protein